jgi:hypothetical protein
VTPLQTDAGEIFIVPVNRKADETVDFFFSSEPGTNYVIQLAQIGKNLRKGEVSKDQTDETPVTTLDKAA